MQKHNLAIATGTCLVISMALLATVQTTSIATAQNDPSTNSLDCLIEPHTTVDLSSSVPGVLDIVSVERSEQVRKNQVVAQLRSGVEKAILSLAQARAKFEGDIKARQENFEFAQRTQKRTEELFANAAVALTQFDEVTTDRQIAGYQLERAIQDKILLELQVNQANESLAERTVRSPINGVVVSRHASPGEYVENTPIVRLAQLHPLRVEVVAPIDLFGKIETGMTGIVTPEIDTGEKSYSAEVKIVDRVLDAASGTFGIRLELPNPEHEIPGGLRCTIEFLPKEANKKERVASVGLGRNP